MVRNAGVISKLFNNGKVEAAGRGGLLWNLARVIGVRKDSITAFAKFVLVVLSLASAHYSGFMTQVPFEMVSVVAVDFLSEFISIFVFYFVMSYTISRVFAFCLSQFVISYFHSMTALVFFLKIRWPVLLKKSGARMYKDTVRFEGIIHGVILVFGVYILFDFCYLNVDYSRVGKIVWIFSAFILIAFLMKIGFAARNPKVAWGRLRDKRRVALRRLLFKSFTYLLAGFALGLSYYLGYLRFDKVVDEDSVYIESERFIGMATILMKSGESFLLLDKGAGIETFYYINDKFSVKLEDSKSNKGEPVDSVSLQW